MQNHLALIYIHLATVCVALLLATWLFINAKGTASHKCLGKLYMLLMLSSASISLWIPTKFESYTVNNHFSAIHLLSLFTIFCVLMAYYCIRKAYVKQHALWMIGLYIGTMTAGLFTLLPGRLLHSWFIA